MVKIDKVEFGEVTIGGKIYYSDMIAWWDDKFEEIEKFHVFDERFFFRLMGRDPEIIIVASGISDFVKVEPEVPMIAHDKRVMFFEEEMEKSLEIFHSFVKEGRRAVIVVHNM